MPIRFPIRILLVEDRNGKAGSLLAGKPEFEIRVADKLATAVRSASEAQAAGLAPDILLLDIGDVDAESFSADAMDVAGVGTDPFRMARALLPGIPIVTLSNHVEDSISEAMIAEGAQACLAKDGLDGRSLADALKQAVMRSRSESRRFRMLFDSAPIGILLAVGRRVVMANPSALATLGLTEEELAPLSVLDLFPASSRSVLGKALDAPGAGSASVPETSFAVELERRDGTFLRCRIFVKGALLNDAPAVALYLAPFTAAETTSVETAAAETATGEAPSDRGHSRQSRKMDALGRLAGGVAHDFNNLLTAINGYSEHLLTLTGNEGPLASGLTAIRNAGDAAASLTRRLLTFSRADHTEEAALRVDEAIREMVPMLRGLLGGNVDLRLAPGAEGESARIEPKQFEQIILGLCANAKDAMPAGGILKITTEASGPDADESYTHLAAAPGPHVVITVEDTGTGMLPETLECLFEPFYTTKRGGRGTGLGLATVYGVISKAGGGISVRSAPGRGSSFRIHLPAAAALAPAGTNGAMGAVPGASTASSDAPTHRSAASSWRQDGNHESILVVEDDSGLREMLRIVLERSGYSVLEAMSASDALDMLELNSEGADLVVTDMMLRGESGLDLAESLHAIRPGLPILFISGHPLETLADRGLKVPADAFLEKPFPPSLLADKVRALLTAARRVS
jgi:two-component system cell cycle sensor histidine kinase/response regulator CckA